MIKKNNARMCSRFHCDKRGDRYCCADCVERKRDRCRNPCLNDPARCGLEDKRPPARGLPNSSAAGFLEMEVLCT